MESFQTRVSIASLPPDVPEEQVQLLDEQWLHDQVAHGARLALIQPEGEKGVVDEEGLERLHARIRSLEASLASAQLEVEYLQRELQQAERPRWKKALRAT
jgi:hypothetical protein